MRHRRTGSDKSVCHGLSHNITDMLWDQPPPTDGISHKQQLLTPTTCGMTYSSVRCVSQSMLAKFMTQRDLYITLSALMFETLPNLVSHNVPFARRAYPQTAALCGASASAILVVPLDHGLCRDAQNIF